MANDKKFVVKNGLRADNIQFTDSASGSNQITLNMLNTDTLNFEGDAGSLFSISDDLTGTVFSVGDISGIPIIEVNGDTHNVTFNEFDGKVMIGGTDSGSVDSDILNVTGNIRSTKVTTTGSVLFGGNGSSGGVSISDGMIDIRTGTGLVSKVKFYCEASNAHFQTLQAAPHSEGSSAVIVLPTASGTLLNANGSGASLTALNGSQVTSGTIAAARIGELPTSKITSGTFDSARLPAGAFGGAANATNINISANTSTDTTAYPVLVGANSTGNQAPLIDNADLSYNASTGTLSATAFVGDGSGLTGIAAGGGVTVQDEGSSLATTGTTLNFVGSGVVASGTGATKTITISGGGGGSSAADAIIRSFIFG